MRIAATSDTHGLKGWAIPPCDVFIHAGDMTGWGALYEAKDLADRLAANRNFRHAILVPGNHDECFQTFPADVAALFDERVHILIDRAVTLDGKTFWGSPWTPPFMQWWFMASEAALQSTYRKMPSDLDVLVTHGPPYGILDPGSNGRPAGSRALLEATQQRRIGAHFFGHLHSGGGQSAGRSHNVAACDEDYILAHPPLILDI